MRQTRRCPFDLRRGLSILVRDHARLRRVRGRRPDDAAAGEMQMLAGSPARLVLSDHRLAAIGRARAAQAVSVGLSPLPDAAGLHALAWQRGASRPGRRTSRRRPGRTRRPAPARARPAVPAALVCEVAPIAALRSPPRWRAAICSRSMPPGHAPVRAAPAKARPHQPARVPLPRPRTTASCSSMKTDGVQKRVAIVIRRCANWPRTSQCACTRPASPVTSSATCVATAASKAPAAWQRSTARRRRGCSTSQEVAASAWPTSCAPALQDEDWTRSTPTR